MEGRISGMTYNTECLGLSPNSVRVIAKELEAVLTPEELVTYTANKKVKRYRRLKRSTNEQPWVEKGRMVSDEKSEQGIGKPFSRHETRSSGTQGSPHPEQLVKQPF